LYFFNLINKDHITRVLDIGCGTGALLPDLEALSPGKIIGADIDLEHLLLASTHSPDADLLGANVHRLPFPENSFDIVLCHYFLMWAGDAQHALQEMGRITRPGGTVVAFAEPDYGGRIDHPPQFTPIRDLQIAALQKAGADPLLGRKLRGMFWEAGFTDIEAGVYQGSLSRETTQEEIESEWKVLAADLADFLSDKELEEFQQHELSSRQKGTRLVYVPTFFTWGKVSDQNSGDPEPFKQV